MFTRPEAVEAHAALIGLGHVRGCRLVNERRQLFQLFFLDATIIAGTQFDRGMGFGPAVSFRFYRGAVHIAWQSF